MTPHRTTRTALMTLLMGALLIAGWALITGLHANNPAAWMFLGAIIGVTVIAPGWAWLTRTANG